MTYYSHVKAHQDDNVAFAKLSRKSQLNCICDHAAKHRISSDGTVGVRQGGLFPLEPMGLFVGTKKMTSDTEEDIRFWAHQQLAKTFYNTHKILTPAQFECVDWASVHWTHHNLPRLFQIWAAKHVLRVAGTMKFLAQQDGRSPLCPSCQAGKETCTHIALCPEIVRTDAFKQSTREVEWWLEEHKTQPNLQSLLLMYLRGRGTMTCVECLLSLQLPYVYQEFATSQDIIGWDKFVMGMVLTKLLPIQSSHSVESNSSARATRWITGFITQLLQVVHTQWIYQCVLVHDCTTGTLISTHKEELIKEIEYQLSLGADTLSKGDRFLLKCNFNDLATTSGESQEYWLLAIRAAREESRLRITVNDEQQSRPRKQQRWA